MVNLKVAEYAMLIEFSKSLTAEEKLLIHSFQKTCPPLIFSDADRRKYNLILMAFIEGVRLGRRLENKNNEMAKTNNQTSQKNLD